MTYANGCGCAESWGCQNTPRIWGLRIENSYRIVPIPVNMLIHIHGFEKITMLKNGRTLNLSF